VSDIYRVTYRWRESSYGGSSRPETKLYEDDSLLQRDLLVAELTRRHLEEKKGPVRRLMSLWRTHLAPKDEKGVRTLVKVEKWVGDEWIPLRVQFFPPEVRIEEA
jgi:hypothetical protein